MATPRQIRPGWELGYKVQGSNVKKGVGLIAGASNQFAKIADAVGAAAWRGICATVGVEPNTAGDATLPDLLLAQKQGIAHALVPSGTSASEGDQAWTNALGKFIKRVPYSFSGFVAGQFDESFTAGSSDEWRGIELIPQVIEVCRPVLSGCTGTITADTKYMGDRSQAKAAAQVPRYAVRFTGEKIRNLWVSLITAPGGVDTVVVTVQKSSDDGATWSDTALTCTVTGAAKSNSDLTHVVSLTAGDLLAVKAVSSAGTAADCTVVFDAT